MKIRMAKILKYEYSKKSFISDSIRQQKRQKKRLRTMPFAVNIKIIYPNIFNNCNNVIC